MEIAHSARKHGIADQDMIHAIEHALKVIAQDDRQLFLGPDRNGRILEVVALHDEQGPYIIHAMPIRDRFLLYLR